MNGRGDNRAAWFWGLVDKGSGKSGNYGHKGRKGKRGGSAPGGGHGAIGIAADATPEEIQTTIDRLRAARAKKKPKEPATGASVQENLAWLQAQGYSVACMSKEDIINAEVEAFKQGNTYKWSTQRDLEDMRSELKRTFPREQLRQWAEEGVEMEEIRDRINEWTDEQLEARRDEVGSRILDQVRRVREDHYSDFDPAIQNENDLNVLMTGMVEAHKRGDIGPDATYVLRNQKPGSREESLGGQYLDGQVTLFNGNYAELGIMNAQGEYVRNTGYYSTRPLEAGISSAPYAYSKFFHGVVTHEYGHHLAHKDTSIEERARFALGRYGEDIKTTLTDYAYTNQAEAAAEAYTLKRHPDFQSLPSATQQIVNYILGSGE